ncbi:MAG: helix-turn-helix domain-containing protein [Candidatus Heimdallarchaeota archaeon]|nr:helix-turn-helix domain-containing protein [Candidatus Heimdallarchaeota archaeon]
MPIFHEIPKRCTLLDIAKELGIKRVACQERIRRAQQRILAYYVRYNLFSSTEFH